MLRGEVVGTLAITVAPDQSCGALVQFTASRRLVVQRVVDAPPDDLGQGHTLTSREFPQSTGLFLFELNLRTDHDNNVSTS